MMNYRDLTRACSHQMENLGIQNFQQEANWILNHFTKLSFAERMELADKEVPAELSEKINDALEKRQQGIPLAHIFGEWEFFGFNFMVTKDTLIPRPETETLVDWALQYINSNLKNAQKIHVLDIGAGTGCIGLSILMKNEKVLLSAVEKSQAATEVLKKNILRHNLSDRTEIFNFDFSEFAQKNSQKFDLIVANPPYIAEADPDVEVSVQKFEPASALFSGKDGLSDIQNWAKLACLMLTEKSAMAFEIGKDQGASALEIWKRLGHFSRVYLVKDLATRDRVICGERE